MKARVIGKLTCHLSLWLRNGYAFSLYKCSDV